MKLAVVIPSYNHERYIGLAIESVLGQTRPPDRFVIVDDGSKDGSVDLIRNYEKDGVECYPQENAGAHAAITRAIEIASEDCDLISILNSDDIYELDRFATLLPAFRDSISVVSSGIHLIDDDGEPLESDTPRGKWFRAAWSVGEGNPDVDLCQWLGTANFLATTSNVIARSSFLKAYPLRPYRFNHDYFFLVMAALKNRLAVLPEKLVRYRVHAANTINTDPAPLLREMLRMQLDLYREVASDLPKDADLRRRFYTYTRACWNNVSSLHAGLVEMILAGLVNGCSEQEIEALVAKLEVEELDQYPNSALVNEFQEGSSLLQGEGVAQKYGQLKLANSAIKQDVTALKELNRLRATLMESRWVALGRALGFCKGLKSNSGKTPPEKLANLHAEIDKSGWLQCGMNWGLVKALGNIPEKKS